jgi:hypothetical protein
VGGKLILLALGEADYGLEPGRPGRLPARSSQLPILNEKPYTILCKNIFNRPFWHQWVEKMPSKVRFISKKLSGSAKSAFFPLDSIFAHLGQKTGYKRVKISSKNHTQFFIRQ